MPITANTGTGRKLEPAFPHPVPHMLPVRMKAAASSTVEYTRGTVLGRVSATGRYAIYDPDGVDGTETAAGILAYDISVDTNGLIAFTETAGASGEFGERSRDVGMYVLGYFYGADLKQSCDGSIDAGVPTDRNFRWLEPGTGLTNGVLCLGL